MTYHVIIALPDGRTACADHREPVAPAMHRVNRALSEGRAGNPADYEAIGRWLDDHAEESERCRAGLLPGGECGHD